MTQTDRNDLERGNERTLVVSFDGELTAASDVGFLDAVTEAAGLSKALVADLGGVRSMDLGGACSVVKLQAWAEHLGTQIALFGAGPAVRHALKVTGLARPDLLFRTEAEALSWLRAGRRLRQPSDPEADGGEPFDPSWGWAPIALGGAAKPTPADRRAVGPTEGFGQLWENLHRVRLPGAPDSPEAIAGIWKAEFGAFWPSGNVARVGPAGIAPGEVVAFTLAAPGGLPLSTGALVVYTDPRSFGFATLEGHIQAGWIHFSVAEEAGAPVAQVRSLVRSGDPVYDAGMSLVGQRLAEEFWQRTLESLAARFGVRGVAVSTSSCLDPRRQWSRAANARHNAGLEGLVYGAVGLARRVLPGRR